MSSPLVLFLDEPTSGLDATTTMELIDSLEKLADLGLTIAMVIHQPRMEVLDKIDNLMLLQRGGFPVFIGPTKSALPYFEDVLGCKVPPATSTADFFLDVITANQTQAFDYGDLTECFIKYKNSQSAFDEFNPKKARKREALKLRTIPSPKRPLRITQCKHFFDRSLKQIINSKVRQVGPTRSSLQVTLRIHSTPYPQQTSPTNLFAHSLYRECFWWTPSSSSLQAALAVARP